MKAALEAALHVTWPPEPILVDVVGETGPSSAITHSGPTGFAAHTQAAAGSPCNTDIAPLRLLFHEATHMPQVAGRIGALINDETARQKLQPLPNLWHTLLLFTPSEIARHELGRRKRWTMSVTRSASSSSHPRNKRLYSVIGGHISMARPPSRTRFTTSFAMLVEQLSFPIGISIPARRAGQYRFSGIPARTIHCSIRAEIPKSGLQLVESS
jgi:hypothetical protein